MAITEKYDQLDVGGGHHDGLPATHIADNEAAFAYNFYPFGRLIRRHGVKRLSTTPHTEALTGSFAYRDRDGNWTVVVGGPTGLAKLSGTGFTPLAGTAVAASNLPWDFFQYKNVGYGFRSGAGMRRFDADTFDQAGLAAPLVAPVIVAGGAGAVEAGNYYGVYTDYNTITGAESNPSPKSPLVTSGGAAGLGWTSILASSNGQVNARRLYRTLPDQIGEYFFVATITDNFTTSYQDQITIDELGPTVSFDNGVPPTGLLFGDKWKDRVFASDGFDVFYSEFGLPEAFASDSIINVLREDGGEVRSVRAWGSRLVVGKTNAVYYLTTSGPRTFARETLADRYGSFSQGTMKVVEGNLIWFTGDNFARSDGNKPTLIATSKIRQILDGISVSDKRLATAEIYSRYGLYLCSVPQFGSENNLLTLCYNYKSDAWTVFDHPDMDGSAPSNLAQVYDEDYGQKLYASFGSSGHLYEYLADGCGLDDGTPISARWKSKAWSFKYPGLLNALKRLFLQCTSNGQTITLTVYRNLSTQVSKFRNVTLSKPDPWKVFNLSTINEPAGLLQIGIEYNGEDEFELSAVAMEVLHLARSTRAE